MLFPRTALFEKYGADGCSNLSLTFRGKMSTNRKHLGRRCLNADSYAGIPLFHLRSLLHMKTGIDQRRAARFPA